MNEEKTREKRAKEEEEETENMRNRREKEKDASMEPMKIHGHLAFVKMTSNKSDQF